MASCFESREGKLMRRYYLYISGTVLGGCGLALLLPEMAFWRSTAILLIMGWQMLLMALIALWEGE